MISFQIFSLDIELKEIAPTVNLILTMCEPGLIRPDFLFEDRNARVMLSAKANPVTYIFQTRHILMFNE
jgi:hypothetical protein